MPSRRSSCTPFTSSGAVPRRWAMCMVGGGGGEGNPQGRGIGGHRRHVRCCQLQVATSIGKLGIVPQRPLASSPLPRTSSNRDCCRHRFAFVFQQRLAIIAAFRLQVVFTAAAVVAGSKSLQVIAAFVSPPRQAIVEVVRGRGRSCQRAMRSHRRRSRSRSRGTSREAGRGAAQAAGPAVGRAGRSLGRVAGRAASRMVGRAALPLVPRTPGGLRRPWGWLASWKSPSCMLSGLNPAPGSRRRMQAGGLREQLFAALDKDGSGDLCRKELEPLAQRLGMRVDDIWRPSSPSASVSGCSAVAPMASVPTSRVRWIVAVLIARVCMGGWGWATALRARERMRRGDCSPRGHSYAWRWSSAIAPGLVRKRLVPRSQPLRCA